jgi:hypothetical protein
MLRQLGTLTFAAGLGLLLAGAAGGSTMDHTLSEPAAISLDFLRWIERDPAWLRQQLESRGVSSGYAIDGGVLEATTVDALRRANRIRSFAYFAAPGLRPPYFDLPVRTAEGQVVRCVTLFPRSIAPQIGALDFDREWFSAAEAEPTILQRCRVDPATAAEYSKLHRDAFRARYFDALGDLKSEFAELNNDAAFIATAFDHGFFVTQQDLTGRLRLDRD